MSEQAKKPSTRKPTTEPKATPKAPKATKAPAAKKPAAKKTAPKHTPRVPKAASLLVYLEDYLDTSDIGTDQSIAAVINRLEDSIVAESKAKIRR